MYLLLYWVNIIAISGIFIIVCNKQNQTVFTKRMKINISACETIEWTFNDAYIMCVTNLEAIHGNLKQGKIVTVWYTLETENKSYIYIAINDKTYRREITFSSAFFFYKITYICSKQTANIFIKSTLLYTSSGIVLITLCINDTRVRSPWFYAIS